MPKQLINRLHAGLSRNGVALVGRSGWIRRQCTVLADDRMAHKTAMSITEAAAALRNALAGADCSAMPVTIVLADEWVRLFMVTPPHNSARLSDCEAAAAMRFQTLYGESGSEWQIDADWNARLPFLACAMPKPLLQALRQVADEYRLTMLAIVPQFVAAWNRWCSDLGGSSWFGTVCDNMLTLGALSTGHLTAVHIANVPEEGVHDKRWLPTHLAREALRLNLSMPSDIRLAGNPPECWRTSPDTTLRCTWLVQSPAVEKTMSTEIMLALAGWPQ